MKVFWDANVLMDLFDQARPGHSDAVKLLKQTEQVAATNLCAWHSLSILSYLCAKKFGKTSADEIIQELLKVFEIPATGSVQAQRAFVYNSHDYEDALQIYLRWKVMLTILYRGIPRGSAEVRSQSCHQRK